MQRSQKTCIYILKIYSGQKKSKNYIILETVYLPLLNSCKKGHKL